MRRKKKKKNSQNFILTKPHFPFHLAQLITTVCHSVLYNGHCSWVSDTWKTASVSSESPQLRLSCSDSVNLPNVRVFRFPVSPQSRCGLFEPFLVKDTECRELERMEFPWLFMESDETHRRTRLKGSFDRVHRDSTARWC